jgi:hypothetical protein
VAVLIQPRFQRRNALSQMFDESQQFGVLRAQLLYLRFRTLGYVAKLRYEASL